jgi:hypothetical protein
MDSPITPSIQAAARFHRACCSGWPASSFFWN